MSITCEEVWLNSQGTCAACGRKFNPHWQYLDDDQAFFDEPYKISRCADCFEDGLEDGLEEYEENRRERLARENEY